MFDFERKKKLDEYIMDLLNPKLIFTLTQIGLEKTLLIETREKEIATANKQRNNMYFP